MSTFDFCHSPFFIIYFLPFLSCVRYVHDYEYQILFLSVNFSICQPDLISSSFLDLLGNYLDLMNLYEICINRAVSTPFHLRSCNCNQILHLMKKLQSSLIKSEVINPFLSCDTARALLASTATQLVDV